MKFLILSYRININAINLVAIAKINIRPEKKLIDAR